MNSATDAAARLGISSVAVRKRASRGWWAGGQAVAGRGVMGSRLMLELAGKAVVSGLVIVAVNVAARRLSPALGGWIAAFPLITFLSVVWLRIDGGTDADTAALLAGVLWGLIPTAVLLASIAVAVRKGAPLPVALVLGGVVWVLVTLVARKSGVFGA